MQAKKAIHPFVRRITTGKKMGFALLLCVGSEDGGLCCDEGAPLAGEVLVGLELPTAGRHEVAEKAGEVLLALTSLVHQVYKYS